MLETHHRQLQKDLPDPEVIETTVEPHRVKIAPQIATFAILCLDVQVAVGLPMGLDPQDMVVATKSVQNVDFAQLPRPIACAEVWLFRLLDHPDLATSGRLPRRNFERLADTVDGAKFTFTAIELLDVMKALSESLVHIILRQTNRNNTLNAVEEVVLARCGGCCRW
jgi:hypothetical protein